METVNLFNWKICGVGGYGLQVATNLLGKIFLRHGYFVHGYDEFPSIIKGGPATGQVAISARRLRSHRQQIHLLVCITEKSIDDDVQRLAPGGWLVYDSDEVQHLPALRPDIVAFPAPLTSLVLDIGGERIMRNVVVLGLTLELLGHSLQSLKDILHHEYSKKGSEMVEDNIRAAEAGASYARQRRPQEFPWKLLAPENADQKILMPGNDALGLGALAAGCQFYAGYPMTPSSSLLAFMMKHGPERGVVVRQLPDEIAVANAAIGAAFAGVRSMVATSGGGFALMVESLGLAGMTETPLVIVDAQRPGPSTGLPTWTEQGDLRFVLHAAQGDFPRVVLAPGDISECFQFMQLAFHLSDQYQLPVILLTDKYLAESWFTVEHWPREPMPIDRGAIVSQGAADGASGLFPRYAVTENGVSPRSIPGMSPLPFMANSDEHDVYGLSNEDIETRKEQQEKRMRKLDRIREKLPAPRIDGQLPADLVIATWGSTINPVLDAADMLRAEGQTVAVIQPVVLHPFPVDFFARQLSDKTQLVVVEANYGGQFAGLIRQHTGVIPHRVIRRYDGRPFEAAELSAELRRP